VQRAAALLAVLTLALVIAVIIVTELLRTPTCISSSYGGGCREWSPFPGAAIVAAFLVAIGAASGLLGGTPGRWIALLVSGGGFLVCLLLTCLLAWVDLRDDLLLEAQTLTGLFLVATVLFWRRSFPRWALAGIAVLVLVMVTPYAASLVHAEYAKSVPRASPYLGPQFSPTPPPPSPSATANG
jgi:hypothetical protein